MYLQLGHLPTTMMRHWTPTLNPLCSAKLDVLEFEEFFPLHGTSRLFARNLAEGLHGMLPANDVPVDVLPFVP
jgi:hypothetical protein